MVLALGAYKSLKFYYSTNLKDWDFLSTFSIEINIPDIQWEGPSLIQLDYNDQKKCVLIVNVSTRGGVLGCGTMYFIGNFDGAAFIADDLN